MRLQRGVDPTLVNQNAGHKLFVEGSDNQEIDPVVIKYLLENNDSTAAIGVEPMGGCDNVRSAAQALIYHHPFYYFLIDRDDQSQETVDKSWRSFPNPNEYNMLIWHKRELENYFIDPEYIKASIYLKPDTDIQQIILDKCNSRLFLDAANLTLLSISRELRKPLPIEHFRNQQEFKDQEAGLLKLKSLSPRIDERKISMTDILDENRIDQRYQDFIEELSGGCIPLKYSFGSWLERMSGKEVFRQIANECFLVPDTEGNPVQGKDQNKEIAKQLVRLPLERQPTDFQELVNLLKRKVHETS